MKNEWRKREKIYYLPKEEPTLVNVPAMHFFVIEGKGDPNTSIAFQNAIEALYSLSYGVKMMPKNGVTPKGYYEYTVFPLEGVWSLEDKDDTTLSIDKDNFVYRLMIRQPEFLNLELATQIIEKTKFKKPNLDLTGVRFETITDGLCVQMMHVGSFDEEVNSFNKMTTFCEKNNLKRVEHDHREIYISDFRKVETEKLKTVLRFGVTRNSITTVGE